MSYRKSNQSHPQQLDGRPGIGNRVSDRTPYPWRISDRNKRTAKINVVICAAEEYIVGKNRLTVDIEDASPARCRDGRNVGANANDAVARNQSHTVRRIEHFPVNYRVSNRIKVYGAAIVIFELIRIRCEHKADRRRMRS